ncbi:MAG TPA: uroporphyrinogen decarboxylase family protein [Phycisphaerae bacterium]|nr:uroporphyrinogen decarboxylase family protein [Phycisphaerae bacterium]HRY66875.1 uroporphyrinogen decarboxylase family protein [Phycisphaerae bacterium]HSA26933.1 uroporphyrinogen decarboxylase family protein [Phycisphaerae bacterium]
MSITSRERVLAAFEHQEPDRVPAWCGSSPEFWVKAKRALGLDDEGLLVRFGDDFRRVWARYDGPAFPLAPGASHRTVFGSNRRGLGYGQPMEHPLADATLDQVHAYAWPDPSWMDVNQIRAGAVSYGRQYAILGGDWSPFWHDAIDLLGMENLMLKMYDQPEVVDAVLGHIVDYYARVSSRIFDAAGDVIDIFFIGNDFGSQTGPLLGEPLFRRFILPHLRHLVDLGHAYDLKVMMHCCGGFAPLIPAMLETGLDGLHAIQPSCRGMDLATLKARYGRQILFNGAIDSHHVLINGHPESVRARTREVLTIMKPGGGYVAGASHDSILEQTPVENVLAMFDAIREFGGYGE